MPFASVRIDSAGSAARISPSSTGSLANTVVCRVVEPVVSVTAGVCKGIAYRPRRHPDILRAANARRRTDDADHRATRKGVEEFVVDFFRTVVLADDQPADARFSTGCTRSPIRTKAAPLDLLSRICASPRLGAGLKNAITPQAPRDEDRDHHADDQCPHLTAHRVVDHPRVTAYQRVFESPDQEPVAVDLRTRGNLRWHGHSHHCRAEACNVGYSTLLKQRCASCP